MFGIGAPELLVILVVALLVFGPKRLPELARTLGRGVAEFRRTSSELRRNLNEAADLARIDASEEEESAKRPRDEAAERPSDVRSGVTPGDDAPLPDAEAKPDGKPESERSPHGG